VTTPRSLLGAELDGRYRIVRRIGSGGMGAVYEAVVRSTGTRVAVKVLSSEYAEKPEAAARFRREARAASSISHPCVVRTLDLGATNDGVHYLVMELLEGAPLATILRGKAVDLATFAAVVPALLSGMAAAHAAYVVHRDLKPDNVFLHLESSTSEVAIKIVDFGISKVRALESVQVTGTGMILGTPYYMAPEQARGAADIDQRADVYAAGAIAYELLTGKRPYADIPPQVVLVAMLNERPRAIASLAPELPRGLVAWVERAMAREPDDRFPTASAALAALEATLRALVREPEVAAARARLRDAVDEKREPTTERRSTPPPSVTPDRPSRVVEVGSSTIAHGSGAERVALAALVISVAVSVAIAAPVVRQTLPGARIGDVFGPTSQGVAAVLVAFAWIVIAALSTLSRGRAIARSLASVAVLASVHQAYLATRIFSPRLSELPLARALGVASGLLAVPFAVRIALRFRGREPRWLIRALQVVAGIAAVLVATSAPRGWLVSAGALVACGVIYGCASLVGVAMTTPDVERRQRAVLLAIGLPLIAFTLLGDELVLGFRAPTLLSMLPMAIVAYGAIGPDLLATGAEGIARAQGWVRRGLLGLIAVTIACAVVYGARWMGPEADLWHLSVPAITAFSLLIMAWQALSIENVTATTLATGALLTLFGFLKLDVSLLTIVRDDSAGLWISRIDHFFYVFTPVLLLHIVRATARWKAHRWLVWILWGAALFEAPLALSNAYFVSMQHFWFGNLARASWLFALYQPVNAASIGYSAVVLGSAALASSGARRQGLVLVLIGYATCAALLLAGDARVVLGEPVYPYGNLAVVPAALMLIGVLRAELADVRALLRTTLAHGLASTALVVLLAGAMVAILRLTSVAGSIVAMVCVTLVTTIVLHPSIRALQRVVDRRLGRDQFDEGSALKGFGEATAQLARATDVADAARRVVEQTFAPIAAAVLLPSGEGGFARGPFSLDPDDPALLSLRRTIEVVRCGGHGQLPVPGGLSGWPAPTLLAPIAQRGRLIAVLAIAPSERVPLTSRDATSFLRTFTDHVGVVLENATLHGQVEAAIARKTSELADAVAKLEARLSHSGGDAARAQLLQELRIRVEEMERADASGTRRREVAAALDLLQQLLESEPAMIEEARPSRSSVEPSIETLAARAPGSRR
jgi:eukaryotic-like serine/threonine-protein kinase